MGLVGWTTRPSGFGTLVKEPGKPGLFADSGGAPDLQSGAAIANQAALDPIHRGWTVHGDPCWTVSGGFEAGAGLNQQAIGNLPAVAWGMLKGPA